MKYKDNINLIIVLLLSLSFYTSCDYLDVVPPATATIKDGMKNKDDAMRFLFSCYGGVTEKFVYSFSHNEASVDEFASDPKWDNWHFYEAADRLDATKYSSPWNLCHNYLGQCFLFQRELNANNPIGVTIEDKARYNSEALFLRAYYHFVLLSAYGPIPLMSEYIDTNTLPSQMKGRYHYDACVDSICNWLDQAAINLPATLPAEEIGRANSTICKALKGRVLLYAASPLWNGSFPHSNWKNTNFETTGYGKELVSHKYDQKKWERALQANIEALNFATNQGERRLFDLATSEIIRKNEEVPLPNIPNTDEDFQKKVVMMRYAITALESSGNKETIWKCIADNNNFNSWGGDVFQQIPPKVLKDNSGSWYNGNNSRTPYLYTMEHFYTKSGKLPEDDPTFAPKSEWLKSAGVTNPNIIKLNVNREPRYYAWLSFDGDEYSSKIVSGKPLVVNELSSNAQGLADNNGFNNQTGFFCKKDLEPNIRCYTNRGWSHDLNYYSIIRLPELYLNIAECYAALGKVQEALDYLNIIHDQVGIPRLKLSDVTTKMPIMEWVRNERFIELWGESHRYYDLRRWMTAPKYLKAGAREGLNCLQKQNPSFEEFNQRRTCTFVQFTWSNRMYLLPIQTSEIYSNPQLMQAPGY